MQDRTCGIMACVGSSFSLCGILTRCIGSRGLPEQQTLPYTSPPGLHMRLRALTSASAPRHRRLPMHPAPMEAHPLGRAARTRPHPPSEQRVVRRQGHARARPLRALPVAPAERGEGRRARVLRRTRDGRGLGALALAVWAGLGQGAQRQRMVPRARLPACTRRTRRADKAGFN